MDRLQHQDTYDPVDLVQKYIQDTAPAEDLGISGGIVEHLFFKVKHLFASILLLVKHCDSDFKARIQNNSLDRSYSRLVLWYDAYQLLLGTGKSEIPSDLADEATKYLKSIGLILVDRLILLLSKANVRLEIESLERHVLDVSSWIQKVGNLGDDDGSDTSSNFDYDSYADVAEDLRTDTACLIGVNTLLSTALNGPGIDTSWGTTVGHWEPHQPYCDRISNRFPGGIESLIARLGKANYERYLRCIQKREEDHDDQNDDRADTVVASDFHDSGLGSSIPGKSTYAETVMSYGGDGSQQTVRVPPLSAEARQGKPFTCIACSRTVTISNNSLWKRHLYEDLRPWLCLEPTCSSGSSVFSRRDDWVAHLAFEHHLDPAWEALQCPLCRDYTGPGKASVTRHLGGHLEEIALGSLPVQTDLENNSEDGSLPSTPVAGSLDSTKSSVVLQTNFETNVSVGATTDLPPPLSRASSLSAESLRKDTPASPSSKRHKCPYCEKEFGKTFDLKSHIMTHPQEKPYVCNTCQMRFRRLHDLKRHSKLHTGALPHVCPKCGRRFARGDALARHSKSPGGCVSRGTSMYEDDTDSIFSSAQSPRIHQQGEVHRDTPGAQSRIANDKGKLRDKVVGGLRLAAVAVGFDNAGEEQDKSYEDAGRQSAEINEDASNDAVGDQSLESHEAISSNYPKQIHNQDIESQGALDVRPEAPADMSPVHVDVVVVHGLGSRPEASWTTQNDISNKALKSRIPETAEGVHESIQDQSGFVNSQSRLTGGKKHNNSEYRVKSCDRCKKQRIRCGEGENDPRGPCEPCILSNNECSRCVPSPPPRTHPPVL